MGLTFVATCRECGQRFGRRSLQKHLAIVHGVGVERYEAQERAREEKLAKKKKNKKYVECPECSVLLRRTRLDVHLADIHDVLTERMAYKRAQAAAKKESMAKCPSCPRMVPKDKLKQHVRAAHGGKKYPVGTQRSVWTVSGGGGPGTGKRR